jgi:DNA-binding protein YbaB
MEPARNAALRARMEQLASAYDWMRDQTRRIHEEAAKVTGTAESPDGAVKATVGPRGQLLSLTLDPRASRRLSTEDLSASIVDTVNRAAKDANTRTAELVAPILPTGVSVADLAGGTADPSAWGLGRPLTDETFDAWWAGIRKEADR